MEVANASLLDEGTAAAEAMAMIARAVNNKAGDRHYWPGLSLIIPILSYFIGFSYRIFIGISWISMGFHKISYRKS